MKEIRKTNYAMYIHWELLQACNFSCVYCYAHPKKYLPKKIDIPRVIQRLNSFNKIMLITLTGGEPFLITNFVEFAHELTKKHYIRIDTNLSMEKACNKFIEVVNPEKVAEITFSVHILEREKRKMDIGKVCKLVKKFQKNKFNIVANYVAYPPLLGRMEKDIIFFQKEGIEIFPTFFQGAFNKKNYPFSDKKLSYSKEAVELIATLNPYSKTTISESRNKPCPAGTAAFFINSENIVFPCVMLRKKLGNFFEKWHTFTKVIRCPIVHCPCPFNRNFAASPGTSHQICLLNKTISEKGIFSVSKSRELTYNFCQILLDALRSLWRRFKIACR